MSHDDMRRQRLEKPFALYGKISEWSRTKYDRSVSERRIEAVDPNSRLFIVGEAYAENQVRFTGINWFNAEGILGPSGKNLELYRLAKVEIQ